MTNYKEWTNHNRLEFHNQVFEDIDLTSCKALHNPDNFDFNTELLFEACSIKSFNAIHLLLGRRIAFKDCKIGRVDFYATYFLDGLEMRNCIINEPSTFDCGVHNKNPSVFLIDSCIFHGHLGFFDVYFEGPVEITNNDFRQGTSIGIYLRSPFGIKEGLSFKIDGNKGQLDKYADNDPFNQKKR